MRDFSCRKEGANSCGFTLIELLVVIAIVAVLVGIMVVSFGRSTESARAAKCLANMRTLAQGANTIAMNSGWYPTAGSIQRRGVSGSKFYYDEQRGWISWLSNNGDPFGHRSGNRPNKPVSCDVAGFSDKEGSDDALFAITNGTMWTAVNMDFSVYQCPTHARAWLKSKDNKTRTNPLWSYVMNGYFGYDYSEGKKACGSGYMREYGKLSRADRILLFAEIPLDDPDSGTAMKFANKAMKDSILQYRANVSGDDLGKIWSGTPECIGFNHANGQRGKCGHVAFADGHVEKFVQGNGTGLNARQLTAILCEGRDAVFDGQSYDVIKD